jgi:hypothetical protein
VLPREARDGFQRPSTTRTTTSSFLPSASGSSGGRSPMKIFLSPTRLETLILTREFGAHFLVEWARTRVESNLT